MGDLELLNAAGKAAKEQEEQYEVLKAISDEFYQNSENAVQAMKDATRDLAEIETDSALMGEKTLAMEQINRLLTRKQREFSKHEEVRRTMLGVVRDLNPGLVRKKTVRELSDELWINCPEYWLAHALVAVSAWINDDPQTCRNAVEASVRVDAEKSALLFCLMFLRVERMEAASAWLEYYLRQQDPSAMQAESGILLQAYLGGLFGRDVSLEKKVEDIVNSWQRRLEGDHQADQMIRDEYLRCLTFLPARPRETLRTLREYSPSYEEIESLREGFGRMEKMLETVAELREQNEQEDPESYRRISDQVLDSLLHERVPEERDIDREIEYYELICKHGGNTAMAQAERMTARGAGPDGAGGPVEDRPETAEGEEADRRAETDQRASPEVKSVKDAADLEPYQIGLRLVSWALDDKDRVSPTVRLYAMRHTSHWLIEAAAAMMERTRKSVSAGMPRIRLRIGGWRGETDGMDYEDLEADMRTFFEKRKRQIQVFNIPNMTALVLLVLSLALAIVTPYAFGATAAAAVFLAYRLLNGMRGFRSTVERSLEILEQAVAEASVFYEEARGEETQFRMLLEEIGNL